VCVNVCGCQLESTRVTFESVCNQRMREGSGGESERVNQADVLKVVVMNWIGSRQGEKLRSFVLV